MVIYNMPAVNAAALNAGIVEITPVLQMRITVKHRTGTTTAGAPIYGPGYDIVEIDITNRLLNWPSIGTSKPRVPGDGKQSITAYDISIVLANPDGYIGATADGTIIRPSDIQEGRIQIFADIGTGTPVEWFSGRIDGLPTESRGRTEFRAVSTLWEVLRKPILYENWGPVSGQVQSLYATERNVLTGAVTITSSVGTFKALHGIATFDAAGNATPWAKREGGGSISLAQVVLTSSATLRPGVYRIEFLDPDNFTVSYPAGAAFLNGNRNRDTRTGSGIDFLAADWSGVAEAGSVIEFQICLTLWGNPVAIMAYILERGLLANYGTMPGITPSVLLDLPAFVEAAKRFNGMPIHFTATNSNNEVWGKKGAKPIDAGKVCQLIADHICSSLVMLPDGVISIKMPFIDQDPLWEMTTEQHLTDSIVISAADETYNYLRVQYGFNPATNTYAAESIGDYRESTSEVVTELVISLPYIAVGVGDRHAEWVRDTVRRRHLRRQVKITTKAIAQFGLPLLPGDFLRVISDNPAISQPCEVVQVNSPMGGLVGLTLAAIQEPEGPEAVICSGVVGGVGLW